MPCPSKTVTFDGNGGETNNNLIQLVNVLYWAHIAGLSVIIPAFLHDALALFNLTGLNTIYCARFGSGADLRLGGTESYYMYHDSRGQVEFLDNRTDKHTFTVTLYKDVFLQPGAVLEREVRCALSAIRRGSDPHVSEHRGWCPIPFAGDIARAHLHVAVHVRDFGKGGCEERVKRINASVNDWCPISTHSIHSALAIPGCGRKPLFIATASRSITPHLRGLKFVMSRGGPASLRLWVDMYMLAVSSCTMLHPASTFSRTVGYLKLAMGRSPHEAMVQHTLLNTSTLNWFRA